MRNLLFAVAVTVPAATPAQACATSPGGTPVKNIKAV